MTLRSFALATMVCLITAVSGVAQTYTSSTDGAFGTGSNWSGGTGAPPLSGQSYGSVTVQNNMSTSGNYTVGSFVLNVSAGKTFTINGNLNQTNSGGTINVYGTLIITGTLTASANTSSFIIYPGGTVYVQGAATINNNNAIVVGDNTAPGAPYASMVFESNVSFASGGAGLTVNENGRVAVYGNITSSGGGGQILNVNNGGQMYVNGNIALTGNGDQINNNNSTNPYGLYVNGTTTNSGGGATITSNEGNKAAMQSGDPGLYSWVKSLPSSPLPVTLLYFIVDKITETNVELNWATASELNFNYFEIEKSIDGKNFSSIGQVGGHGTTKEEHLYSFTDDEPIIGKNYYQLKSVDFDGHTEVFEVIVADFITGKKASVYPNPVTDHNLHVDLNFEDKPTTQIIITDLYGGQRLASSSTEIQTQVSLQLEPGIYVVTVVNGSFKQVSRLLVK